MAHWTILYRGMVMWCSPMACQQSSAGDRGFGFADGDRFGQTLLVAGLLDGLDGLLQPGAEPGAGGEGGGEVLHAVDDGDALVVHRSRGVAPVVGHAVEHGGD